MAVHEQETVITFDEASDKAQLYTASSRVYRLMTTRGLKPCRTEYIGGEPCGWFYELPKAAVIIKPANHSVRIGGRRKMAASVPECAPSALSEGVS
jgi:hypothetical protein